MDKLRRKSPDDTNKVDESRRLAASAFGSPEEFNKHIIRMGGKFADIVIITDKLVKELRDNNKEIWAEMTKINLSNRPMVLFHLTSAKEENVKLVKGALGVNENAAYGGRMTVITKQDSPKSLMIALDDAMGDVAEWLENHPDRVKHT